MNSLVSTLRLGSSRVHLQQFREVSGVVKFFNLKKGWGIITTQDDPPKEIFVHQSSVQMDGFRYLEPRQPVEFDLVQTERGPQAQNVKANKAGEAINRKDL